MTQKFKNIELEDYIDEAIFDIQDRDDTVLTMFSGNGTPTLRFEDQVWNDVSNKVLKRYNGSLWETIIDYSEEYVSKVRTESQFQPVNSTLSAYSETTVNSMGILNTGLVPLSYFFRDTLLPDFANGIGLKSLAYKSKISTSDIADSIIANSKLNPSIIDTPVFQVGDCIPSMNNSVKDGCVKLSTSASTIYTVGASASGSTYKGEQYKNLFRYVVANLNLPIYTSTGILTTKSGWWEDDWRANKRAKLPHIDLPEANVPSNITVTSGSGVELTITKSAYYELTICGGGGGGAAMGSGTNGHQAACSGASGGGFKGIIILDEGDVIQYTVGSGGVKGKENASDSGNPNQGGAGGTSNVKLGRGAVTRTDLVTCTGGGGGRAWWRSGYTIPTGGSTTVHRGNEFVSISVNTNGANGVGGANSNLMSVNGPFGDSYGKGGSAQAWANYTTTTQNGGSGYFALKYIAPKEYGTTDATVKAALDKLYSSIAYFMKC